MSPGCAGPPPPPENGILAPVTRVSATYIHAARIDESGLRALARRALEQSRVPMLDQGQTSRRPIEDIDPALLSPPAPDLGRSELVLPPRSRRSA